VASIPGARRAHARRSGLASALWPTPLPPPHALDAALPSSAVAVGHSRACTSGGHPHPHPHTIYRPRTRRDIQQRARGPSGTARALRLARVSQPPPRDLRRPRYRRYRGRHCSRHSCNHASRGAGGRAPRGGRAGRRQQRARVGRCVRAERNNRRERSRGRNLERERAGASVQRGASWETAVLFSWRLLLACLPGGGAAGRRRFSP
ncbi:hypothetical protein DFH27DRAFT_655146, partial [Peziza echinospora]